jgi:hypothetical protein
MILNIFLFIKLVLFILHKHIYKIHGIHEHYLYQLSQLLAFKEILLFLYNLLALVIIQVWKNVYDYVNGQMTYLKLIVNLIIFNKNTDFLENVNFKIVKNSTFTFQIQPSKKANR